MRFSHEELTSQPIWDTRLDGIIISKDSPPPIRIGCQAIQQTWDKMHPATMLQIIEVDSQQDALPRGLAGNYLIVGTPETFALAASIAKRENLTVSERDLNGDGFIIKPIQSPAVRALFITSAVPRGVLYGMYELEERITQRGIPLIDQSFIPAVRYRNWAVHQFVDEPPSVSGRLRLNLAMVMNEYWPSTLFYKSFPELRGRENAAQILQNQAKLHKLWAQAVQYGALPVICWNPLSFAMAPTRGPEARAALERAHPGILATVLSANPAYRPELGKDRINLCPSNPATRLYVRSAVQEFVTEFPETGMILMYFSDIGGELNCGCEKCARYPFIDRVVDYANLVMGAALEINPKMRFMMRNHALNWFVPMYHPEYADDPTAGFGEIMRRLGPRMEAVSSRVTSPPGGDFQSWLGPTSTLPGHGVPFHFFFHYYEAGGPGTIAPISPVISHLSWQLPICVQELRKLIAPGMGMIGGDVDMAGMEVAYWHPDMDPGKYLTNWCRAKYGDEAGACVAEALLNSSKITEMFYAPTKPALSESCTLYRWGHYGQQWAVAMGPLREAGLGTDEELQQDAVFEFMHPLARQPDELEKVDPSTMSKWIDRFAVSDERRIAERARAKMKTALELYPGDKELQRLNALAMGTVHLVNLYHNYHSALVYANAANNTGDQVTQRKLRAQARESLSFAVDDVANYWTVCWPLTEQDPYHRLKRDFRFLYISTLLATVREACYLFDREDDGGVTLRHFDELLLSGRDSVVRAQDNQWIRMDKYTPGSKAQARQWQERVRGELLQLMHLSDLVRGPAIPFDAKVIYSKDLGGYIMKEVEINSTKTRRMKLVLTVPRDTPRRAPAVVAIGGHSSDRYSVFDQASELPRPPLIWDDAYYGFATELTKKGYVTITTTVSQHAPYEEGEGRILMGERLWDLMRCVDYLDAMPEVDPARIGCAGLSLGGEMAMWLGAMDERVSATVSAGWLSFMDNLYLKAGSCQCFYFPGLRERVDFPDIYGLIAPRALQCQNGVEDNRWFSAELAQTAMHEIQEVYADRGHPTNAVLDVHNGGHIIDLPQLLKFFDANLGPGQHVD